ncbi:unnamed protein product [Sphagnum tenellum]
MLTCSLIPIETQWGRLCVSVAYRKATAMTALEVMPPLLLHIIADYVGSPATDPLRQLSSVGVTPSGGIHGRWGVHVVSSTASIPNSPSFGPHHSWSGSLNKPSLYQIASNMLQLSPINSQYSPHFSQSLSPSPTHGYSPQDDHLYSSSAPVSIPHPSNSRPMEIMSTWVPSCNPQLWHGAQVHSNLDSGSATLLSISEFIEFSILEFISHQFHYYHVTNVIGHNGDQEPPLGVRRPLHGSPGFLALASFRAPINVSSLLHNDMDNGDFALPFAIDYDEADEYRSMIERPVMRQKTADTFESLRQPGSIGSQLHAAVGDLVRILRSAPRLQQLTHFTLKPARVRMGSVGVVDSPPPSLEYGLRGL